MSPKKAIIILLIIALIITFGFIVIWQLKSNIYSVGKNAGVGQEQKPLTDEEKRLKLLDNLSELNKTNGAGNENLTPAQEQAEKQELLNNLQSINKQTNTASQVLTPAEQEKKKQELLNLIK